MHSQKRRGADYQRWLAEETMRSIREMDEANTRADVDRVLKAWKSWASSHRIAPQIHKHMDDKAAGIKAEIGQSASPPAPVDRKSAATGDR